MLVQVKASRWWEYLIPDGVTYGNGLVIVVIVCCTPYIYIFPVLIQFLAWVFLPDLLNLLIAFFEGGPVVVAKSHHGL